MAGITAGIIHFMVDGAHRGIIVHGILLGMVAVGIHLGMAAVIGVAGIIITALFIVVPLLGQQAEETTVAP